MPGSVMPEWNAAFSNSDRRITLYDSHRRYRGGNDTACTHDGTFPNCDSGQNKCAGTDINVVLNLDSHQLLKVSQNSCADSDNDSISNFYALRTCRLDKS